MPSPSYSPSLNRSNYLWRRSSLCSFLHPSDTSSLFSPNILLSTLFKNTLSLLVCSYLSVRYQISHPYRTTGKSTVLNILIFKFLRADEKTEGSALNGSKHYQNSISSLISSCIKFWFVTVVPKYFNCDTFSNDLFAIFMSRYWPAFWWRDNNIYLVSSTFISRPTSLLA
jgi:hypothetical protein